MAREHSNTITRLGLSEAVIELSASGLSSTEIARVLAEHGVELAARTVRWWLQQAQAEPAEETKQCI